MTENHKKSNKNGKNAFVSAFIIQDWKTQMLTEMIVNQRIIAYYIE